LTQKRSDENQKKQKNRGFADNWELGTTMNVLDSRLASVRSRNNTNDAQLNKIRTAGNRFWSMRTELKDQQYEQSIHVYVLAL